MFLFDVLISLKYQKQIPGVSVRCSHAVLSSWVASRSLEGPRTNN